MNGNQKKKSDYVKDLTIALKQGPVKIHDLTTDVTVRFTGDKADVSGRLTFQFPGARAAS